VTHHSDRGVLVNFGVGGREGKDDDDDTKAVQSAVEACTPCKSAIEQIAELFVDGRKREARDGEVEQEALFEEIGRLKMELDWLKKSWSARLKTGARLWSWPIPISAYGGNASCWG
jgi:hypothetical protein